jgi:hypothetical protein
LPFERFPAIVELFGKIERGSKLHGANSSLAMQGRLRLIAFGDARRLDAAARAASQSAIGVQVPIDDRYQLFRIRT